MTSVVELLVRCREKLTPEDAWVRAWYALDVDGSDVESGDPAAVCWCLVGGLVGALADLTGTDPGATGLSVPEILRAERVAGEAVDLLAVLSGDVGSAPTSHDVVELFNDTHTHGQVLDLLDRAIEEAGTG